MNAQRRREPQLERWLTERADSLREPREGFAEMLAMVAVTPQRRHRWWPSMPAIGPWDGPDGRLRRLVMALSSGLAAVLLVAVFGFLAQGLLVGPAASLPPPSGTATEALLPAAVETTVAPDVESSAPAATRAPTETALPTEALTPTETDSAFERYRAIVGGLETRAVAPGVTRVVADAIGRPMRNIDRLFVAPDGRVWIIKRKQIVEVGERGGHEQPEGGLVIGHDGRLFRMDGPNGVVRTLGDDGWEPLFEWPALENPGWFRWRLVGSTESGELWATSPEVPHPARFDGDAWTEFQPRDMNVDWPPGADLELIGVADLELASDGSVWAWLRDWPDPQVPWDEQAAAVLIDTLVRYDGVSWQEVTAPGAPLMPLGIDHLSGGGVLHAGQGSSMWVQRTYPDAELLHWDGDAWSTALAPSSSDLVIDREERVWTLKRLGDPALLMFDGSVWSTYGIPLALGEERTLQLAPDDSLWILSAGKPYILHPDEMEPDGGAQS